MTDYSRMVQEMASDEKEAMKEFLAQITPRWIPQPGPQTQARDCQADIMFYGGSAGGGKTDLVLGLGITDHKKSLILRREGTQFRGIITRMTEIMGGRDGYTASPNKQWKISVDPAAAPENYDGDFNIHTESGLMEFGSCPNLGDEMKHQGISHDLLAFDEICHFLEFQFRFLMTWLRSTTPGRRCRVVATGNPPTDTEGVWVREYWAPWLDPECPVKARPGELLWYATDPSTGEDTMVPGPAMIELGGELVKPLSRTFIPSSVDDNIYLTETGYKAQLQSLPEPLRSQMLHGDFTAGMEDNAWQVIPSSAVRASQKLWKEPAIRPDMTSIGIDVARGGRDNTILARRHGKWYDKLLTFPGKMTPKGGDVAALFVQHQRDAAVPCVDAIGVGTSVVDYLQDNGHNVAAINSSAKCDLKDKTGKFGFVNLRAHLYWSFREALMDLKDPIILPPDSELLADLCAPRFTVTAGGKIQVERKKDIIKRLGRSPDRADAVVYAFSKQADQKMFMGGGWVDFDTPLEYDDLGVI